MTLPIVLVVVIVLKLSYPSKPSLLPPRMSLFFITLFLTGPVLLVNGLLKPFWGRPRPVNVEEFGGMWPFLPAWMVGPEGLANRSFSSGEAATAACLLPLILFLPREWRWQVGALLSVFVATVSLNRIAFGAHFLSDVLISIGLMLVLAAALRHLIFVHCRDTLSDEALERQLTALGHRMAADRAAFRRGLSVRLARARGAIASFFSPASASPCAIPAGSAPRRARPPGRIRQAARRRAMRRAAALRSASATPRPTAPRAFSDGRPIGVRIRLRITDRERFNDLIAMQSDRNVR
ncbi:phosphatase PAP2 family protein [Ancylobacter dichloromethanicus]